MPLPPNNLKAPIGQQIPMCYKTDLAEQMEEFCRTHMAARISPYQTPLWCDRFENCRDCMMYWANQYSLRQTNEPQEGAIYFN